MLYKIRVILNSDAKEDVFRDIEIRSSQNLWNLHQGIKSAFSFTDEELASFYFSDEDWNQLEEIPLEDMTEDGSGEIMSDITLERAFPKLHSRMLYVYDYMAMWTFYVELIEISDKEKPSVNYPLTVYRYGAIPLKSPNKGFDTTVSLNDFDFDELQKMDSDFDLEDQEDFGFDDESFDDIPGNFDDEDN